ncbi:MAG: acetate/propionate family kinase [Patescibacteria group bacterium]|jgi:acetate kinase
MILVINCGSSSLKYKLLNPKLKVLASGLIERVNGDYAGALSSAFSDLKKKGFDPQKVTAVGHRVVHGGSEFLAPTALDARVISKLKALYKLAPLHNPPNVLGIEAAMKLLPGVPNVAVFDTAFYRDLPDYAYMYALPYTLYEKHGVRKYGFHGISHAYVAGEAAKKLKKPLAKLKLVTCHLGSGASVTAVKNGKAVDTSMGFTPLEGLTMSTRCGDIDPEIPLWLIRELKMTPDQVDDLLNKKSGMLGIAGTMDMRDVLAKAATGDKRSKLALEMFVYDVVRYVGQYMTVMGGCDAVVFTAGVGERSKEIRAMIMKWLKPFKLKALVVPTDEESMIARETVDALK